MVGVIVFLLVFVVIASLSTFLILAVVFNQKRRLVFLLFLICVLVAAPLVGYIAFNQVAFLGRGSITWETESVIRVFTFVWSLAFAITTVLIGFYAIGFRMLKRT